MKAGRVVILLAGRRAGKKAVIVKPFEEGKKGGQMFSRALVAGVERAPLRVTRRMSANQLKRRSNPKPFVKVVNFNHILPTRFQVTGEFAQGAKELKSLVTEDRLASAESRKTLKKEVRGIFRER